MLGLAWKSLGWFLASVAVTLGFLLVPLQVAAERKKLDRTIDRIQQARRDLRALETEFDTRANLAQLDRWNAETLGLVAPAAGQFVADEAALASLDLAHPVAGDEKAQMAFVPSAPVDVRSAQFAPVAASAPGAASAVPVAMAAAVPAAAPAPTPAPTPAPVLARVSPVPRAVAQHGERPHRQAVALLDRALLDDAMIGDLRSGARAEGRR